MKKLSRFIIVSLCIYMSLISPVLSQNKVDTYPGVKIYFGYGGGFTGLVYTYVLLENGDLYQKKPYTDTEFEFLTKTPEQADSIFKNYSFLGIDTLQLSEPGNTYNYITVITPDKEKKLVWSKSLTVPGILKSFYRQLVGLIPQN